MAITCPACGKRNDGGIECARCGCEISILERIARAAEQELRMGKECLVNGNAPEAFHHAESSWFLKKSPEAARLAFLACLAAADFRRVRRWYARAGK